MISINNKILQIFLEYTEVDKIHLNKNINNNFH